MPSKEYIIKQQRIANTFHMRIIKKLPCEINRLTQCNFDILFASLIALTDHPRLLSKRDLRKFRQCFTTLLPIIHYSVMGIIPNLGQLVYIIRSPNIIDDMMRQEGTVNRIIESIDAKHLRKDIELVKCVLLILKRLENPIVLDKIILHYVTDYFDVQLTSDI